MCLGKMSKVTIPSALTSFYNTLRNMKVPSSMTVTLFIPPPIHKQWGVFLFSVSTWSCFVSSSQEQRYIPDKLIGYSYARTKKNPKTKCSFWIKPVSNEPELYNYAIFKDRFVCHAVVPERT